GAAYANDGINALPRDESSQTAVQSLGLWAKLQHFSEHGDTARGRSIPKQLQHGAHGFGISVVTVVDNRDAVDAGLLAAHFAGRERADSVAQSLRRDAEGACGGDAGENVRDAVAAGEGRFEIDAERTEARTLRAEIEIFGANFGVRGYTEEDRAACVETAEFADAGIVGVENGHAFPGQGLDELTFRPGDARDAIGKVFGVGPADVGDDADLRLRDGGEVADFAFVIHAHFEDGDFDIVSQTQDGERQAEMVVQIAEVAAGREFGGDERGDGVFRSGLAGAAGDADDDAAPELTRAAAERLESAGGVIYNHPRA